MNENRKYEVIMAVVHNNKNKKRACVELNLSLRQVNRLVKAYIEGGKAAFIHGNRGKQPPNKMNPETKEIVINVYKTFVTQPNFKHFTEILSTSYNICYSDTTIRQLLYSEGILSPKSQRKTRRTIRARNKRRNNLDEVSLENPLLPHVKDFLEDAQDAHPSRPRKKYKGELIQMDASSYKWFGDEITHLHLAIDDASGEIVGGYFDTQETLRGYYQVFHQILKTHGVPASFFTDRRTVFVYESQASKKMEDDALTQFGYACHQLGVEIKTSSVPQAKGRVERLNGTAQSRLPVDLERAGVKSIEEANKFLVKWIKEFNEKFSHPVKESVYEEAPNEAELNLILARIARRVVDSGHHVRYMNHYYIPTDGPNDLYFSRKSEAVVIESFNGDIYFNIADKIYTTRELLENELYSEEFDIVPEKKKERRKYIPPQSHPWKLASFKQYLHKIGKTYEEYLAEQAA